MRLPHVARAATSSNCVWSARKISVRNSHSRSVAREEFGAEDLGAFARAEDDDPTTCVEAIVQVDALAAIGVDAQLATGEHRAGDASGSKAHRKPRLGFR